MRSTYVDMLLVTAPGEQRIIKQEYDYGIINRIIGIRSMMVPVTPRLGVFVDPRKSGDYMGVLLTAMAQQPTRLVMHGKFVFVAFEQRLPDDISAFDILKIKLLYRSAPVVSQIREASAISEA